MAATNVSTPTSRGFADEIAMHALAMLPGPYLPWSAGTMRPAGLVTVCNDIVLNDRRRVVELGSGISTVLLARLLTQRALPGGVLMAVVEHDDFWAQWVGEQLVGLQPERRAGLAQVLDVGGFHRLGARQRPP